MNDAYGLEQSRHPLEQSNQWRLARVRRRPLPLRGNADDEQPSVTKNTIRAYGDQTIIGAGIYAHGVAIDFNGGSNVTTMITGIP